VGILQSQAKPSSRNGFAVVAERAARLRGVPKDGYTRLAVIPAKIAALPPRPRLIWCRGHDINLRLTAA
jgi:hypothetical protein